MRIVSGKYKGRAINPPRNLRARPTTDFAKENLFNVLGNLVDFEECDVLDLFAGTGSISYEFASRGARSVTSVEINPVHYNFIRQTAAQLGIEQLHAVKANVFLYLKNCTKQFDIVFSDAPYDLERGGRRPGAEGRSAAPGRHAYLRALEEDGFFLLRGVLAIKKLRQRAIFFLQKRVKSLAVSKIYTIFALAIPKNGALVQLVRIRACHARGQGFESPTHRQKPTKSGSAATETMRSRHK